MYHIMHDTNVSIQTLEINSLSLSLSLSLSNYNVQKSLISTLIKSFFSLLFTFTFYRNTHTHTLTMCFCFCRLYFQYWSFPCPPKTKRWAQCDTKPHSFANLWVLVHVWLGATLSAGILWWCIQFLGLKCHLVCFGTKTYKWVFNLIFGLLL